MKRGPGRFPVIAGTTASGKTDVALAVCAELARRVGAENAGEAAEIVSADAYQVYRGMDIGTAKASAEARRGVRHHLIDIVEPTEAFSVSRWLGLAEAAIGEIRSRGRTPVVVGGTHLYVQALLRGLFEGPEPDAGLRAALAGMTQEERRRELERVDPAAASRIHRNDERRTIRALEVYRQTGRAITAHQGQWESETARHACVLVIVERGAEETNRRIEERVREMVRAGLVEEARGLQEGGRLGPQAREAIGYKQLAAYFRGDVTLEEAVGQIVRETRRLARNQRTWLRRLGETAGAVRVAADGRSTGELAQLIVEQCFAPQADLGGAVRKS